MGRRMMPIYIVKKARPPKYVMRKSSLDLLHPLHKQDEGVPASALSNIPTYPIMAPNSDAMEVVQWLRDNPGKTSEDMPPDIKAKFDNQLNPQPPNIGAGAPNESQMAPPDYYAAQGIEPASAEGALPTGDYSTGNQDPEYGHPSRSA